MSERSGRSPIKERLDRAISGAPSELSAPRQMKMSTFAPRKDGISRTERRLFTEVILARVLGTAILSYYLQHDVNTIPGFANDRVRAGFRCPECFSSRSRCPLARPSPTWSWPLRLTGGEDLPDAVEEPQDVRPGAAASLRVSLSDRNPAVARALAAHFEGVDRQRGRAGPALLHGRERARWLGFAVFGCGRF